MNAEIVFQNDAIAAFFSSAMDKMDGLGPGRRNPPRRGDGRRGFRRHNVDDIMPASIHNNNDDETSQEATLNRSHHFANETNNGVDPSTLSTRLHEEGGVELAVDSHHSTQSLTRDTSPRLDSSNTNQSPSAPNNSFFRRLNDFATANLQHEAHRTATHDATPHAPVSFLADVNFGDSEHTEVGHVNGLLKGDQRRSPRRKHRTQRGRARKIDIVQPGTAPRRRCVSPKHNLQLVLDNLAKECLVLETFASSDPKTFSDSTLTTESLCSDSSSHADACSSPLNLKAKGDKSKFIEDNDGWSTLASVIELYEAKEPVGEKK